MHIAALSQEASNYSLRRFRATAKEMGIRFSRVDPSRCDLLLGSKGRDVLYKGKALSHIDVAMTRRGAGIGDLEITMVNHLEHSGTPVLNGTFGLLMSRDKFWSLRRLADKGIPVPRSAVLSDPASIDRVYRIVGEPPVVLKVLRGMRGVGVMIADSRQSVRSILETFHAKDERVLVQEFIKESAGADIRVLVVGGKVIAAMKRQAATGEFRSNIHRGGEGTLVKPTNEMKRVAKDAARIIGLDIAGVDLIMAHDGPRVVEVNSSPGFEGLEKATGQDIASLILRHAVDIAEGKAKPMTQRLRLRDTFGDAGPAGSAESKADPTHRR